MTAQTTPSKEGPLLILERSCSTRNVVKEICSPRTDTTRSIDCTVHNLTSSLDGGLVTTVKSKNLLADLCLAVMMREALYIWQIL
jgi:hypothetical protein